ncbi:Ger(x)C family spore germination protein [Desulfosporosinus meridiei]|uniref:Germination protein, Ger(X)C family n=1 Tax=Desulfosporosinus meridiei (strain ATCC BAA-275 / DSM 13257 / KCTC 12902 / NCIMB 13706 / S10) TaxID=768704 RepID=J7IKF1_DESMD|nr:Ger(x)C family spore germination protein [Desulfosporosinus meridiei]AFQ42247.1 germination protein, Ger(X)C family [Desulfosporosinus meridiei DSM 13257]
MRNKLRLLCLLPLLILTPGCWDLHDVNSTAFVLGIGIDLPSNSSSAKYKVTFQLAKPISAHEGPTTQSFVISKDADSILQAIQQAQASLSRRISLSHLRAVAIGEDIARRESFQDLINYLLREPDLAMQLRLVFVQNAQARDLLSLNEKFEDRPSAALVNMGCFSEQISIIRTRDFLDFLSDLKGSNGTAYGSRALLQTGENLILRDGAAVFKDSKLVAWLNGEEVQAANWLVEKNQAIVVAKTEENTYTYEVRKKDTTFKPIINGGNPSILVKVTSEGMVMEEYGEYLDLSDPETIKELELLFAETIAQQVKTAIQKSQKELKADYLGFHKAFRRHEPEAFKSLNWNEVYPTMPIEVEVECKLKAYGLRK